MSGTDEMTRIEHTHTHVWVNVVVSLFVCVTVCVCVCMLFVGGCHGPLVDVRVIFNSA